MDPDIEAALLTGGASHRMGQDKAGLTVDGEPLAHRIARLVSDHGIPVTVLGRCPIEACGFLPDEFEFEGPLAALSRFVPSRPFIFIVSCDLPGFDPQIIGALRNGIGNSDAAIPLVGGRPQPLCSLYRKEAIVRIAELVKGGERRVMTWIDSLRVSSVELSNEGWATNANTPDEWQRLQAFDGQGLP